IIVTGEVSHDPRIKFPAFQEEGIQAQVLVPMHSRGRVIGILSALSYEPYEFSPEELAVLRSVADQVGTALDNARLYNEALAAQSRMQAIVESSADAIIAIDEERRIEIFNSAAESLLRIRTDYVLGKPFDSIPFLPDLLFSNLRQGFENGEQTPVVFDDVIGETSDRKVLSCTISPVGGQRGVNRGYVVTIRDVTHIRAREELKTQTIQTAAHDLRSPLFLVENSLSLLSEILKMDDRQRRIFEMANTGVNRMRQLITSLLNIEQVEAGLVLDTEIDLATLADRVVADNAYMAVEKNQALRVEIREAPLMVRGNTVWLERALTNFISNACKYAPVGSPITVRVHREGVEAHLEVEDIGPGIALEVQSRLFERFFRIYRPDETESTKGTGLGLAIVKRVAEQHGGHVFVRSHPGTGSVFGMVLPLLPPG
ncbi:MAG: GAF domain-containing protein, partial [Anaerolineae bacterium]|nr:GAF domain-containing protein [Anaerolineae bacterium]